MLSAAEVLREGGIDPADLAPHLDGVDPDRVPIRLAPWWVKLTWAKGISGMTAPWVIWLDQSVWDWDARRRASLVVHELAHSAQWMRHGWVDFSIQYLREYLQRRLSGMSHQEAYRANPFEIEANELRERIVG